ncbi:DDE-type integrase/transposase/recombinase [bacterium]|nr:DDE-type integrase/transposase/recombinase [bacterium]
MENTKDNTNIWIDIDKASEMIGLSSQTLKRKCRKGEFVFKIVKKGKVAHYFVLLKSMPDFAQDKYLGDSAVDLKYSEVPSWAKLQAEKYVRIIDASAGLKGKELKEFIDNWNNNDKEEFTTSYPSLIRMRRRYFRYGVAGLISKHGQHLVGSCVPDDYFEYFKTLYLIEGGPSLRSCRDLTLGYAVRELGADRNNFPSFMAFKRRLDKEIPEQSIFLARNGQAAWNRKYNNFIDRDYSAITCNQVWVSDHAQIDVACYDEKNKVVFPWVTVWRDYKSGKWLGWILQTGNPNSDLIFQSFYYAVEEFGLPKDVIIDNGKDYRSKDFAGGRKDFKIETNKNKTSAMLKELNVNVHFALPYNAQTKPVERDFLKIKELLSKHCIGYRGGNVVERPEKLAKEIKDGKIMKFEDFKELFDKTIINILNKRPSNGKNLNGRCPDDLFYEEYKEKIVTSKDALKLFCSRTSNTYTISKNGVKDGKLQTTYWADWMIRKKGMKVYLRRDIKNYKEAWVFNAENDEFIGKAEAFKSVAALYAPEVSKEEFEAAMATKKRNIKLAKSYIKQNKEISVEEKYKNYETAYQSVEREYKKPVKVSKIANTSMDKVIQKNKDMESYGKADLSIFLNKEESPKKKKFYYWNTDKELDEPDEELYLRGTDRKITEQQKKIGCG